MATTFRDADSGVETYEEREVVAVFDNEGSLNAAVDQLMESGLRQDDMSLLAESKEQRFRTVGELADSPDTPRSSFVSSDARTEGLAAVVGAPALLAGLGAAAVVGTGGAALIPTLAATVGSTAAAGSLGLIFARAFGRKHAERVQHQIMNGGMLLWVHAPDPAKDAEIVDILTRNGGRDVHIHVVTRIWGVAAVPFNDAQPDPLLR